MLTMSSEELGLKSERGTSSMVTKRAGLVAVRSVTPSPDSTAPPFVAGSMQMLTGNKIYWLMIFVPLAILAESLGAGQGTIFALCCLAILPLAGLLGDATEQVCILAPIPVRLHSLL